MAHPLDAPFFQSLIYLSFTVYLVVRHSRRVGEQATPLEKSNLFWIRNFLITLLILWGAAVFRFFFAYDSRAGAMLLVPVGLSVWIYILGYMALRQPEALVGGEEPATAKKYERSTLTPERAEEYLKRLLSVMETAKPFTDGDLTLQKLAKELSISPHHLSQIINERLNQNFFDFLNAYRIKEAMARLVDPGRKHYSILAIAEEVGFNSKSAFNTAFRKHAHMTPSEFRKASNGNGSH